MGKIDKITTREEILEYASKPFVIFERSQPNHIAPGGYNNWEDYYNSLDAKYISSELSSGVIATKTSEEYSNLFFHDRKHYIAFEHEQRLVGWVKGYNADGSPIVALLANNYTLTMRDTSKYREIAVENSLKCNHDNLNPTPEKQIMDFEPLITWVRNDEYGSDVSRAYFKYSNGREMSYADLSSASEFMPEWTHLSDFGTPPLFCGCSTYAGNRLPTNQVGNRIEYTITANKDTTLILGDAPTRSSLATLIMDLEKNNLYCGRAVGGNFFLLQSNIMIHLATLTSGVNIKTYSPGANVWFTDYEFFEGNFAFYWLPYNLVLTEDYNKALNYINTGELPSDAWLYPLDLDAMPVTDGTPPTTINPPTEPPEEEEGDPETGTSPDNITPTPTSNPAITPQSLNHNNLYWLQGGELASFIDWFWNDAGTILDTQDLWQKLQGLYNDLASAIIAIRYMPVDVQYIGGVATTNSIIVGQVEKPQTGVNIITRGAKATLRTLGTTHIKKKYKTFCDYSPYCELSLYMPFYGFLSLDIDLFVGHDLTVQCVYDIIGGTIQYFIFRDTVMVNTVIAKMCVDIPITLQSKNDRDSAIFQNVGSAVGNMIGAGTSVATHSPIGLVMATTGIATGGSNSAPLKVFGTQGESGAFYGYDKCFIILKHPQYNRPSIYDARVGYPCNESGVLGKDFGGFTIVHNPTIRFNQSIKPIQAEVDEIYSLLEKGVII